MEKKIRLDKWLWAARFFKTRSLAAQAINGGKVHVNGARAKAARGVEVGEEIRIRKGTDEYVIMVRQLSAVRRGAPEAALLYLETEESRAARLSAGEERRLIRAANVAPAGRPSKRDRRMIKSFIRKE
ncbi:MAG: S4 domain-containing protein [Desulfobulbaceae bacterium]|nr:S4 domain-containing protein [Desulfobulbaceae bacterium]HIJ78218.1 RNA-binding protein [Deltaproteobacteria bacterium]